MAIYLSETLKRLRKARDLTQEQIAEIFSVSPQAVSRWETGVNHPDIEMLPSIASFFKVTVDELLGYDQLEQEKKIKELRREIKLLNETANDEERLDFARQAVAQYPSENHFQLNLACCLSQEMEQPNPDVQKLKDAENIFLMVINTSADEEEKYGALTNITWLYAKGFNDAKKAEQMANRLPKMVYSRESVKSYSLRGEKVEYYIQDYIQKLADELGCAIGNLVWGGEVPNDESTYGKKIVLLDGAIQVYRVIFGDDMKFYHHRIARLLWSKSTYQAALGRSDEAISTLEEMFRQAVAADRASQNERGKNYKSPFVEQIIYPHSEDWEDFHEYEAHNLCWCLHDQMDCKAFDPIRGHERFSAVIAELEKYAK